MKMPSSEGLAVPIDAVPETVRSALIAAVVGFVLASVALPACARSIDGAGTEWLGDRSASAGVSGPSLNGGPGNAADKQQASGVLTLLLAEEWLRSAPAATPLVAIPRQASAIAMETAGSLADVDNSFASPFADAFAAASGSPASFADEVALDGDDLLFAGYHRPGFAARVLPSSASQIMLFNVAAAPSRRYYGNPHLGGRPSERSRGVRANTVVADNLQLSTGYLVGETTFMGPDAVLFSAPRRYGGDGWNLALDSRWLQDGMRVYLEYAESTFDRDGLDRGAEARQGCATQMGLKLASGKALGTGPLDYWSGDLRYRTVDRYFFTLASPALPADVESLGSWFQFGLGSVSGRVEWRSEASNLAASAEAATWQMQHSALELTYTPLWADSDAWLWQRIGAPSLVTEVGQTRRRRHAPRAVAVQYDTVRDTGELRTVLRFSRPTWRWSARYQVIDEEGFVEGAAATSWLTRHAPPAKRRELAGLKARLNPNDRIALDFSVLWNTRDHSAGLNEQDRRHWGVGATTEIVPDRLSLQLRYQAGRDFETLSDVGLLDDPFKVDTGYFQLAWHALRAAGDRPAIDLFLQGQRDEHENQVQGQIFEQWSVHFGVKLSWAKLTQ